MVSFLWVVRLWKSRNGFIYNVTVFASENVKKIEFIWEFKREFVKVDVGKLSAYECMLRDFQLDIEIKSPVLLLYRAIKFQHDHEILQEDLHKPNGHLIGRWTLMCIKATYFALQKSIRHRNSHTLLIQKPLSRFPNVNT